MLKKLIIEQFVIIDRLDLDLQPGLTILTGETGAGKSIILGAMGLILGEDFREGSIRQGADQSVFEALFAPAEEHPVWDFLSEHNLVGRRDTEFVIRRVIDENGGDNVTVNDNLIEVELLKEIGEYLLEIHGQFANQSMTDPDNQLRWLDMLGDFPQEVFDNVAGALQNVHQYTKELNEEKSFYEMNKDKVSKIESVVRALDETGMEEGFPEAIQSEYALLLTAKETSEAFQSILGLLIASNGAVPSLSAANQTLERQEHIDRDNVEELQELLSGALEYAHAASDELNRLLPEYEIDTQPIYECRDTLNKLNAIARENQVAFEDLYDFYVEQSESLDRIRNARERIKELEVLVKEARDAYRDHAHVLTEKRTEVAAEMSAAITAELPPLKLEKAQFEIVVKEKPDMEWTERGINEVVYTARMNPGMPFSPISDTASGGELARMILALKVLLQGVQVTPTLVFDEVDTGIGGPAAAAVGLRLVELSKKTQVIVITHSPQVASSGQQHLHVTKKSDDVKTTSVLRTLSKDERIDEVSRMLAGDATTEESRAAAKSLIEKATEAATTVETTSQIRDAS